VLIRMHSRPQPAPMPSPPSASKAGHAVQSQENGVLHAYLQRRGLLSATSTATENGLSGGPMSSADGGSLPLPQFALRSLLLTWECGSGDGSVSAASVTSDPAQVEQQYAKFKNWISESPDVFKPELAQLLYPTFAHVCLELQASGHRQAAQKFLRRHQVSTPQKTSPR